MKQDLDTGFITRRVAAIKLLHQDHFNNLRLLDQYSRQVPQNWFPDAKVNLPSVVRSTIRAAEKTAIAFLTGNEPKFRGSRGAQDAGTPLSDADVEKIARAIFHLIDRQSGANLLQELVSKAIKRGEIIFQYGWLDEEQRGYSKDKNRAARFPIFVKSLDRLRVYYEINPFGEPVEVYHEYRTTASQVLAEFPSWAEGEDVQADQQVTVIDAWVGDKHAVMVDDTFIKEPTPHGYGDHPPFIIEQCAAEDVSDQAGEEFAIPVMAGTPLCYDMLNPFKEASVSSSLKRVMLENTAIGSWVVETNTQAQAMRQQHNASGDKGAGLKMGPGNVTFLYPGEKLLPPPVQQLPPALAAHLSEAEGELASLGFSPALLRGEVPGDPSGYSIEQVRQAAMARLQPYKASGSRAFSRLFEQLFVLLADNWAPEWGTEGIPAQGTQQGKPFSMTITEEMVSPPPDHIEVELVPMLPQNQIAMWQAYNARVVQGTMDPVEAMGEMGSADPVRSWEDVLIHKEQMENPQLRGSTVQHILEDRDAKSRAKRGLPPVAPQGLVPTGNMVPAPPPGAPVVAPRPPVAPLPLPPQGGPPGPPPQGPNPAAPLGVLGAPNQPMPTTPRPNQNIQR